ncbi:hypothetical protein EDB81DRAFT_664698 [Dactylonectria macrodidyma]|uniref:Kinesin light chain n=1 Tax=Dactylonectria macrodidyma TaxID=307937 RepID=A0A9P9DRI0_9HYPO|nr:hypothetical protein EDB81DRAFT_664698 [Dactylonectria macrodidyma]
MRLGRYVEDEDISIKVLNLRRSVLGEKHPDTIRSMADLAATYHTQGRYVEDLSGTRKQRQSRFLGLNILKARFL